MKTFRLFELKNMSDCCNILLQKSFLTIISRQKFGKITNFCVIDKFSIQQHFKISTQHCYPCAINYDYIVKVETSNQDAENL